MKKSGDIRSDAGSFGDRAMFVNQSLSTNRRGRIVQGTTTTRTVNDMSVWAGWGRLTAWQRREAVQI